MWMRYVNFAKVKDLLLLITENNGTLKAGTLEQLAVKRGVFTKADGKLFSHSPRYHYRKVIEHLGMAANIKGLYFISEDERVKKLSSSARFGIPLTENEREIIAEIVIDNPDCRRYFFDCFIDKREYDLLIFRREANWIRVKTKGKEGIILHNPVNARFSQLDTEVLKHAIFWGVRLWSLELGITDEIFLHYEDGRLIYPIRKRGCLSKDEIISNVVSLAKFESKEKWSTMSMQDIVKEVALSLRVSVKEIKEAIEELKRRFPEWVDLIPSSSSFIDFKTPFALQDQVLMKAYLQEKGGRFISHIKIHQDLYETLRREGIHGKL